MSQRKEPTVSSVLDSKENVADRRPRVARQHTVRVAQPQRSEAESSSGFIWFTFLMAMVAIVGVSYMLWQLQLSQKTIEEQRFRIIQLEKKLTISDDTASQSLASVSAKVIELSKKAKLAASEIDKLWATRNINRKAIAENSDQLRALGGKQAEQKKQLATLLQLQKTVANVDESVKKLASKQTSLNTSLDAMTQSASEQELLLQSLRERVANQKEELALLAGQAKIGGGAVDKLAAFNTRLTNTEEVIKSLEAFRRTVNRDLRQLKQTKK